MKRKYTLLSLSYTIINLSSQYTTKLKEIKCNKRILCFLNNILCCVCERVDAIQVKKKSNNNNSSTSSNNKENRKIKSDKLKRKRKNENFDLNFHGICLCVAFEPKFSLFFFTILAFIYL